MATLDGALFAATLLAALGSGLMAGLFFAFSTSIMKALARRPAAEGMAAMQAINAAILNPLFGLVFTGSAAACLVAAILSLFQWNEPGAIYSFVGGTVYLAGGLLVTLLFNVPRNEALASAAPADPGSAALWADYLSSWTAWNHVRTATSLVAAASLTIALSM